MESPFENVDAEAWEAYVEAMAAPDQAHAKSATGHLGLFLFAPPRLAALGYVRDVQRAGPKGRHFYTCKWNAPHTEAAFLEDPALQYAAFEASNVAYAASIGELPPLEIDGVVATMSGVLAVAHHAGLPGLAKWLKSQKDRKLHPFTTSAFKAVNGGF